MKFFYFFTFILLFISTFFFSLSPVSAQTTTLAFPTAEGFGAKSAGGRGGQVLFVTNLNDNGPGSFRAAVETSGPRIIIFRVGGTINLESTLTILNPYITIAGQTAPGGGISLRRSSFRIATHDVILRGIKARVGDEPGGTVSTTRRGISITSYSANTEVYNIIIDHVSVAWGVDTNMSTWKSSGKPDIHDVTIQWSIDGEALYDSIHVDEGASSPAPHSKGLLIGANGASNFSIHHNLFANNQDRNPRVNDVFNTEVTNNLIYGYGSGALGIGSDTTTVQVINNYFKPNANSIRFNRDIRVHDDSDSTSKIHFSGNITDDYDNDGNFYESVVKSGSGFSNWPSLIISDSTVTVVPAKDVPELILGTVGSYVPLRDSVDIRIVQNTINRTGSFVDSQNDVGGWPSLAIGIPSTDTDRDGIPDDWETSYGLDLNDPSDASQISAAGYMMVEEYINSLYGEETVSLVDNTSSSPIPSPTIPIDTCNIADIDRSGKVDLVDYSLLSADFFSLDSVTPRSDINQDGFVNLFDYSILSTNFFVTAECL